MSKAIKYILLIPAGLLIILVCSLFQHVHPSTPGEYYYSEFLRYNYTFFTGIVFFVAGLVPGYYFKLKPWLAGFCFILVFPLTSLYEGTVYRGSHNLLPFEFIIHFLFALPSIAGAHIGRSLSKLDNIGSGTQILLN